MSASGVCRACGSRIVLSESGHLVGHYPKPGPTEGQTWCSGSFFLPVGAEPAPTEPAPKRSALSALECRECGRTSREVRAGDAAPGGSCGRCGD